MPTYDAKCTSCEVPYVYASSVSECLNVPDCPVCLSKGTKVILKAPMGFMTGRFEPFRSTVDGSLITNSRQLREHNLRNGVVNLNEGYSEEKVLSGEFGTRKQDKQQELADISKDIGESIQMVNAGYKPEVRCEDEL